VACLCILEGKRLVNRGTASPLLLLTLVPSAHGVKPLAARLPMPSSLGASAADSSLLAAVSEMDQGVKPQGVRLLMSLLLGKTATAGCPCSAAVLKIKQPTEAVPARHM